MADIDDAFKLFKDDFELWDEKLSPATVTYSFLNIAAYGLPNYYGIFSGNIYKKGP